MNKQKLIDKWANKTGAPTFEMRGVTERASMMTCILSDKGLTE